MEEEGGKKEGKGYEYLLPVDGMVQRIMWKMGLNVLMPRRHNIVNPLQLAAHATGRVLALLYGRVVGVKTLLCIMVVMGHAVVAAVDEI